MLLTTHELPLKLNAIIDIRQREAMMEMTTLGLEVNVCEVKRANLRNRANNTGKYAYVCKCILECFAKLNTKINAQKKMYMKSGMIREIS